jgi:hypothetical protein
MYGILQLRRSMQQRKTNRTWVYLQTCSKMLLISEGKKGSLEEKVDITQSYQSFLDPNALLSFQPLAEQD